MNREQCFLSEVTRFSQNSVYLHCATCLPKIVTNDRAFKFTAALGGSHADSRGASHSEAYGMMWTNKQKEKRRNLSLCTRTLATAGKLVGIYFRVKASNNNIPLSMTVCFRLTRAVIVSQRFYDTCRKNRSIKWVQTSCIKTSCQHLASIGLQSLPYDFCGFRECKSCSFYVQRKASCMTLYHLYSYILYMCFKLLWTNPLLRLVQPV